MTLFSLINAHKITAYIFKLGRAVFIFEILLRNCCSGSVCCAAKCSVRVFQPHKMIPSIAFFISERNIYFITLSTHLLYDLKLAGGETRESVYIDIFSIIILILGKKFCCKCKIICSVIILFMQNAVIK